ncbi:MAG: prepilin-type N-terminal cleavage/methylation domain-containing protein, partial [Lentisphaeria bacterium]|nr:prepilin-type N-terminal cleavage/methylation domain-containing protein [Lentisphaeria bacterium]
MIKKKKSFTLIELLVSAA